MAKRHPETAEQNVIAWGRSNLALGGYAPRQWAERVIAGEDDIDTIPAQYQPLVRHYLHIAEMTKALMAPRGVAAVRTD